jgi:hypothetical protein
MDETGLVIREAAFIVGAVLATIAQVRFFKAVEDYQPGAAAPDDEVIEQLAAKPSSFASIMVRATGRRLSALARRWPDPGVERARRWALISIVVALALFGWIAFRIGG